MSDDHVCPHRHCNGHVRLIICMCTGKCKHVWRTVILVFYEFHCNIICLIAVNCHFVYVRICACVCFCVYLVGCLISSNEQIVIPHTP